MSLRWPWSFLDPPITLEEGENFKRWKTNISPSLTVSGGFSLVYLSIWTSVLILRTTEHSIATWRPLGHQKHKRQVQVVYRRLEWWKLMQGWSCETWTRLGPLSTYRLIRWEKRSEVRTGGNAKCTESSTVCVVNPDFDIRLFQNVYILLVK